MRKNAVKRVFRRCPLIIIAGCAFACALWASFKTEHVPFFVVIGSVFGAFAYGQHVLSDVRKNTKNHIVANVCKFIGWEFSETVASPPDLQPLVDNFLLPKKFHRVNFEDKMTGNVHGADFEALECHMERKVETDKGTKWKTVFRGSVMVMDFHREFLGRTVVLRDKGFFNTKSKGDMKRVGLVDPVFEKAFEAYSTDQVESRYLLTPDFMQKLVDLETSVDGNNIRFAFLNELLLVVVETPNRFEAGSMFKPLIDTARTQKILDEVGAVINVVDGVIAPNKLRT